MADKFKQGVSVVTSFVEGETPSPAKLNSITAQLRYASAELEKAVGDTHDSSHPYSATTNETLSAAYGRQITTGAALGSTRYLNIANIARLVGPAGNLNPRVFVQGAGPHTVTESISASSHEVRTRWPIDNITNLVFSDTSVFASRKANASDVAAAGDYYVDSSGYISSFSLTTVGTVQYEVDPSSFGGGANASHATFNVIPDQAQLDSGGSGCTVAGTADAQGRYSIQLPTATHIHSNIPSNSQVLAVDDLLNGQQLTLPEVITANYAVGNSIPEGFLYLKNYTTGQVFESGTYYYVSTTQLSIGGSLDSASLEAAVAAGNVFQIFTVGYDLTTAVADLQFKTRNAHNRNRGGSWLNVESVRGHLDAATTKGFYIPSEIPGNAFPQYLHRDGFEASLDGGANDHNAMRGSIVLGVTAGTPGSYTADTGASYGIFFGKGSGEGETRIKRNASSNLEIFSENEFEVESTGTGTSTIKATNASGKIEVNGSGGVFFDTLGANIPVTSKKPFTVDHNGGNVRDGINDVGLRIGDFGGADTDTQRGLNFVNQLGSNISESICAGPTDGLAVTGASGQCAQWAIDQDGVGGTTTYQYGTVGTTSGSIDYPVGDSWGWRTPRIQILHLAASNIAFTAHQENGSAATGSVDVEYYKSPLIRLPGYLAEDFEGNKGVHSVLSCNVMVKGGNEADNWYGGGDMSSSTGPSDRSPGVTWRLERNGTSDTDNGIVILLSASTAGYMEDWLPVNVNSADDKDIDVKITLVVASPGGGASASSFVADF